MKTILIFVNLYLKVLQCSHLTVLGVCGGRQPDLCSSRHKFISSACVTVLWFFFFSVKSKLGWKHRVFIDSFHLCRFSAEGKHATC